MNIEEARRIVQLVATAQGPEVARRDVRRPELEKQMAAIEAEPRPPRGSVEEAKRLDRLYERVYFAHNCEWISEAEYLVAKAMLNPAKKDGRPPKHDWEFVVSLAVAEVRDAHYHDQPMPTVIDLSRRVSDRYTAAKGYQLDEYGSDLRKWCSAVLKGFEIE